LHETSLLNILDVLYDSAIERNSWSGALEALAKPVGGVTGHLLNWDKSSGLIPHYEVFSMDDSAMEDYASKWVLEDPRAAYLQSNPQAEIFFDEMHTSARQKQQQAFFSEWEHRDTAQRYLVGRRVFQSKEREIIFSLGFEDPHGAPRDSAVTLFEKLGSHLHRAVEIHHLFGRHMLKQTPELQILDGLSFGVVFLDELGRPGFFNRRAERISERGDGLRMSSDGLRAKNSNSDSHLQAMIRSCRNSRRSLDTPSGGWIKVNRDGPGPDYSALVIPMPDLDDLHLYSHPRVLILVSDPAEGREDVGSALGHLYDLTVTEIRVCLSLVAGNDTHGIANELSVSRGTVRFHLKNIFGKTGVKRQGELIRLVLALPTSPEASH
jgi:DNA-binding CsgD family transcriptional regulator